MKRIIAWAILGSVVVTFIVLVLLSLYIAALYGQWWWSVGLGVALALPWAMSVIEAKP